MGVLDEGMARGAIVNSIITKDIMERHDDRLLPGHIYIHGTSMTPPELDLVAESTDMQMAMAVASSGACIERCIRFSLSIDASASVAPDLLSQMRLALQLGACLTTTKLNNRDLCLTT